MQTEVMKAAEAFRQQGEGCAALGSHMYAELLHGLARDIDQRGPTARVLRAHEDDPGPSALALRLLGSVHRLVLERRAGGLAAYYPSVGGHWHSEHGVPAEHPSDVGGGQAERGAPGRGGAAGAGGPAG